MRRYAWLGALAAVGCGVPPNASPVSFGVPDGMVLGRDPVVTHAHFRSEVVTFAVADRKAKAYVTVPLGQGRWPADVRFSRESAWPAEPNPREVTVTVATSLDNMPLEAAARAMVTSLEEVDPDRITISR